MYITLLVALLSALVVGTISGGGSSSISAGEDYWNNVLPKTSMPKAIKDLLPADNVLSMTSYETHRNKGSTAKVLPVNFQFGWDKASTAKVLPISGNRNWNKASTAKVLPVSGNRNWDRASTAKVLPVSGNRNWNKASTAKVLPVSGNRNWNTASTAKVLPVSGNRNWDRASTAKVLPVSGNRNWDRASTAKVLPVSGNRNWNKASTAKVLPVSGNRNWNKASTAKVLPISGNRNWNKASTAKVLPVSGNRNWNKASTEKVLPVSGNRNWNKASTSDEQIFLYDPTITRYFFEEDLRQGSKMRLSFPDTSVYGVTFISNAQSKSIPFSSSKHPNILSFFSINLDSALASAMKETLDACEDKQMEGEKKHCATSLESMVDFTTSVLNTHNLVSVSTTTDKENASIQEYELTSSYLKSSGDNTVVCHAQTYAYAVFYCHKLRGVNVYDVEMVGEDGTKVKAVATCHTDTSKWNPDNLAMKILNVKPGTVPVCHFLPQYDVLWMAT